MKQSATHASGPEGYLSALEGWPIAERESLVDANAQTRAYLESDNSGARVRSAGVSGMK